MGRLLRIGGAEINPPFTNFGAKEIDDASIVPHKSGPMMSATTKTTTKTKPVRGSGGVRA